MILDVGAFPDDDPVEDVSSIQVGKARRSNLFMIDRSEEDRLLRDVQDIDKKFNIGIPGRPAD